LRCTSCRSSPLVSAPGRLLIPLPQTSEEKPDPRVLHEAVYDQPEPTCWSIARVRLHAIRVLLCSECYGACAGHHSWAFVSGVRWPSRRRNLQPQAEILLQCTCEQVVIAWGQQTWSFLYQNNHKVTILFPCIQSSETVCPKSCTEYPTDVIPPSYVLLWTCPLVDPCISNKTSRRPRVLTHSLANRAISVLQSCKSSLLRTSTNVVAYITSKLLMTD
jgi:hypothetical protein